MTVRVWRKKDVLRESLLGLAHNLGAGQRLPTVATLCKSLSVSNSTLDPILRGLERQGAIVREHGRGIFVAPTIDRKTIGVVFGGDIFGPGFSPFWNLLLQAVREQSADRDMDPRAYLDISQSSGGLGGHAQLADDLADGRLDGLLLLSPRESGAEADELRAAGVPMVCFGGHPPDWSVTLGWDAFLELAAKELAPHACRRIGLLGPPTDGQRLAEALGRAGVTDVCIDDWSYETWACAIPGAGTHENCAHRLTQKMIAGAARDPLPEALVSLEDTMTRGAITALHQAGLQPGRDIRIVTAENIGSPVLEPYAPQITRITFDTRECMRAALNMLATLMDGGTPPESRVLIAPQPVRQQGSPSPVAAGGHC